MPGSIRIRFYEELNDFLPPARRKNIFDVTLFCSPSIKDIIEAQGVPHPEVDLIVVNGQSVSFDHRPKEGDMISVYPVFESLDITKVTHLRPKPLRITRFILDVHLGKLVRYLRMLGFDSMYRNDYDDPEIVALSKKEKRIILTRDVILLKNNDVTHGLWIRSQKPSEQVKEVIRRLDLHQQIKPFDRCMECNGRILKIEKKEILDQIEPGTKANFDTFYRCRECHKVYWNGSHFEKMQVVINNLKTAE
jgi:uncharacterized protein with PIN domain